MLATVDDFDDEASLAASKGIIYSFQTKIFYLEYLIIFPNNIYVFHQSINSL